MSRKGLSKFVRSINYFLFLGIIIVICDMVVFRHFLDYGYPRHYEEEDVLRYPVPYIEFTGKPDAKDHNEFGFRGKSLEDSNSSDYKIAFWGGSTGYFGDPTIAEVVEKELNEILEIDVFVANYSVVSSNHRQHLHGLIEYLPKYEPDLVIFYGGYNELVQTAYYDPRPGYPYNFFYRAETSPLIQLLVENSALIGEFDKLTGRLTGIRYLRDAEQPFSENWNNTISEKYFETLELANNVASSMESKYCGTTRFLAFYQPYQVPEEFLSTHESVKLRIAALDYAFDISSELDMLGEDVYEDIVHVNQEAMVLLGKRIASIVAEELLDGNLKDCHLLSK